MGQTQERRKNDKYKSRSRSSHCGSVVMNLTSIHEDVGLIPGLTQWLKDPALLQAVVGCRCTNAAWIQCCHGGGVGLQ